jgi:hypothetical protein
MLKMKESCERCHRELTPDGRAMICSYECTFCAHCTAELAEVCPNCDGELVARPRRTTGVTAIAVRTPGRVARLVWRKHD